MKKILTCFALCIIVLSGCPGGLDIDLPPAKSPYFPVAVNQQDDSLYIVSYNKDLRYGTGNLLQLDLSQIDAAVTSQESQINAETMVTASAYIPSFSRTIVFSNDKEQMLLTSRSKNQLLSINLAHDLLNCETGPALQFGNDCLQESVLTNLSYENPYYLMLLSENTDQAQGVIGYLNNFGLEDWDTIKEMSQLDLNNLGKIQTFMWDKTKNTVSFAKPILLQKILDTEPKEDKVFKFRDSSLRGMQLVENKWLFVGENSSKEATGFQAKALKEAIKTRIVWFEKNNLPADSIPFEQVHELNLTDSMQAKAIAEFVVAPKTNGYQIFAALKDPNLLAKFNLEEANGVLTAATPAFEKQIALCNDPVAMSLSPDQKTLLVACGVSNELVAYDTASLTLVGRAVQNNIPFGNGPVHMWFDTRAEFQPPNAARVYVSYWQEGTVGIFEINNLGEPRLKPLSRLFEPAPSNHMGGK